MTVLGVLLHRLEYFGFIEDTLVLTSARPIDDEIEKFVRSSRVSSTFRGSATDVGERFLEAANVARPSHIVRLTGDNPFVPEELLQLLFEGSFSSYDYVSTKIGTGYPVGCDVEFFSLSSFRSIRAGELSPFDREHVTPPYYLPRLRSEILSAPLSRKQDEFSSQRLTVDTEKDLIVLREALLTLPKSSILGPWEGVARRIIQVDCREP